MRGDCTACVDENSGHIDADFAYVVKCAACGAMFEMGTRGKARRMAAWVAQRSTIVVTERDES